MNRYTAYKHENGLGMLLRTVAQNLACGNRLGSFALQVTMMNDWLPDGLLVSDVLVGRRRALRGCGSRAPARSSRQTTDIASRCTSELPVRVLGSGQGQTERSEGVNLFFAPSHLQ